jgi:hypothetical protein
MAAVREEYTGQVTEPALEARLVGVDARIPWLAFGARAGSSRAIVLVAGQLFVPLARTFFTTEHEWLAARAIIEHKVPLSESQVRAGGLSLARSVVLWLGLLVVIFLAWHFAQISKGR